MFTGAATVALLVKKIEEKDSEKKELEKKLNEEIAKMKTKLEAGIFILN